MADDLTLQSLSSNGTATSPKKQKYDSQVYSPTKISTLKPSGTSGSRTGTLVSGAARLSTGRHLSISGR